MIQEQAAELERCISHTQASVTRAHERQQQLQSQSTHLKRRVSTSTAALEAILSLSSLLPDAAPVPDPLHQGVDGHAFTAVFLVPCVLVCPILGGVYELTAT